MAPFFGDYLNVYQVYPIPGLEYINRFFTPLICRVFVKIVPEKCEGYIFQPCMKLADVPCWAYARYVVGLVMLCVLIPSILFPLCFPYNFPPV